MGCVMMSERELGPFGYQSIPKLWDCFPFIENLNPKGV